MPTIYDLGQKVKAKYPGVYDDMSDDAVGRAVKTKFPGQYDDFVEGPQMAANHTATPSVAASRPLSFGDKALNMIGRGAWALPGLVGLDYETAQSVLAGKDKAQQYRISQQVDRENPITSGLVRGIAAAPSEALAWAAAPEVKLAQGAGALTKALAYGPRVGAAGAASEYGSTGHKPLPERLEGAAVAGGTGAVLGGTMAGALPNPAALFPARPRVDSAAPDLAVARADGNALATSRAASAAAAEAEGGAAAAKGGNAAGQSSSTVIVKPAKRLRDVVNPPEPIPEARYLRDRGVQLTGGLNDPNSAYGHIEIASQSRGIVGPGIRNQRQRALGQAMDLAFEEARPPGIPEAIGARGTPNDKYTRLKALWDREFDAVRARDEVIQPAIIRGEEGRSLPQLMEDIVSDAASPEAAVWDEASRVQAKRFLDTQMSRLFGRRAEAGAKDEAGRVPLGDMLETLSDVRKARRTAQQREKWDLVDIYSRAEDAIEEAVSSQASPETSKRLRELFGGYRNFKIVEDAVLRMRDAPGGISPAKLEQAVASTVGRGSEYAKGGGGALRDLSKSVRTVFDESGSPPTGARVLADIGWLTDKIAGPTIYMRNRSAAAAQGGAAAARGGKVGARALSAAKGAARARLKADAAASGPPSTALAQFLGEAPGTLHSQSPATMALSPELQALLDAMRVRPARVSADEESR
jgi:hypothetical protein